MNTAVSIDGTNIPGVIRERWPSVIGKGGLTGYLAIPEVFLRCQNRMKLNSTEMMVLNNVLLHRWSPDRNPFPSNNQIAKRMGISARTVQRALERIQEKGLITRKIMRIRDEKSGEYRSIREIDIGPLVARLQTYARDLGTYAAEVRNSTSGKKSDHRIAV
ncbi:MAG: helix-turn-helix domain-containing protein [Pseudomonadota bacterium]